MDSTEFTLDRGMVARRTGKPRRFVAVHLGGTPRCPGPLAVAAGSPVAATLVALDAPHVGGYTAPIVARPLRRDPASLRVGPHGPDDGSGTVPWAHRSVPFGAHAVSYPSTLDRLREAFGRHVMVHSGQ